MRAHYDFSKMKWRKNPYAKFFKKTPITIRLNRETIGYFKAMAAQIGLPYQSLIDFYLRDCVLHKRKLNFRWASNHSSRSNT